MNSSFWLEKLDLDQVKDLSKLYKLGKKMLVTVNGNLVSVFFQTEAPKQHTMFSSTFYPTYVSR